MEKIFWCLHNYVASLLSWFFSGQQGLLLPEGSNAETLQVVSNWPDFIFFPVSFDYFLPFIVVRKHRVAITHIAHTHRYVYTNNPSAYSRTRTRSKTKRRCLIHESAESRGRAKDGLQIASFNRIDSLYRDNSDPTFVRGSGC